MRKLCTLLDLCVSCENSLFAEKMHFVVTSLICTQVFAEYCDVGPQRAPGRGGAREPVLQLRDLLLDLAEDVAAADDLGRGPAAGPAAQSANFRGLVLCCIEAKFCK